MTASSHAGFSAGVSPGNTWAGKPLVFVVEDEDDIARLICFHLDNNGYAVRWFPSSADVIDQALKDHPSLFLLDIMIPGSDGLDLCRQIRLNRQLVGAHIIFLTAKTGEADRVRGLELGGDDYVTKPSAHGNWSPACARYCGALPNRRKKTFCALEHWRSTRRP